MHGARTAPHLRIHGSTDLRAGCNRDGKVLQWLGSASGEGGLVLQSTKVACTTGAGRDAGLVARAICRHHSASADLRRWSGLVITNSSPPRQTSGA